GLRALREHQVSRRRNGALGSEIALELAVALEEEPICRAVSEVGAVAHESGLHAQRRRLHREVKRRRSHGHQAPRKGFTAARGAAAPPPSASPCRARPRPRARAACAARRREPGTARATPPPAWS